MKRGLFIVGLLTALFAVTVVAPANIQAQAPVSDEPVTVAIVSVQSVDGVLDAASNVLKAAGQDEVEQAMRGATGAIEGIDTTKPAGVVVTMSGMDPMPGVMGFLPVTDLMAFVASLPDAPPAEMFPEPDADGIRELQTGPDQSIFMSETGEWLVVSQDRDAVLNAPTDPTTLLEGLDQQHLIAVKVIGSNVPDPLKQGLPAMAGMFLMGANLDQAQQQAVQSMLQQLTIVLTGTDTLLIGADVSSEGEVTVNTSLTTIAGSELAEQFAATADSESRFATMYSPTALVSFLTNQVLPQSSITQMQAQLEMAKQNMLDSLAEADLSDNDRQIAQGMVNQLFEAADATIASGKSEAALTVNVTDASVEISTAATVVDGDKIENVFKQLVGLIGQQVPPVAQGTTLNATEASGIRVHTVTVPLADFGPGAPPEFADGTLAVTGYFSDDLAALKIVLLKTGDAQSAIDAGLAALQAAPAVVPMQQFSICAEQIPTLMTIAGQDPDMLLGGITPTADDKITLVQTMSAEEGKTTITIAPGMFALIGQAIDMAGSMMGPMGGDFEEFDFEEGDMEGFEMEEFEMDGGADPFGGESPF